MEKFNNRMLATIADIFAFKIRQGLIMFDKYEIGICPFPMIREGQFMESRIHRLPFLSFFKKFFNTPSVLSMQISE
jgi:hypothetical protein